jgi:hypothetical protein
MSAGDASAEGSGTQPGAGDASAEESGTGREDKGGWREQSSNLLRQIPMCPHWAQEWMV